MRIVIAAIGRMRRDPTAAIMDTYARRLKWSLTVKEFEAPGKLTGAALKREEGRLLASAIPDGAMVVTLDERGEIVDSAEFAGTLGRWRDTGRTDVAFILGGADGLDEPVVQRADLVLSLGRMTWPHLLARALVVEQIYRAQQILSGHPYHRA